MVEPGRWIAVIAAACCAACSPALDWREFVAEGSDLTVTFPCRPDRHARTVVLAGAKVQMNMLVCTVEHASYAITFAALEDPARISAVLAELRVATVVNVQGRDVHMIPFSIKGMTPNDETTRLSLLGHLPDGMAVREQAAFFSRGLRVYQATVVAAEPVPQAAETFFSGLRFQ